MESREQVRILLSVLKTCLAAILDNSDALRIRSGVSPTGIVVFTIYVPATSPSYKSEYGRLLGLEGQTIQALRKVMSAAAGKLGTRVTVETIDLGKRFPKGTPA